MVIAGDHTTATQGVARHFMTTSGHSQVPLAIQDRGATAGFAGDCTAQAVVTGLLLAAGGCREPLLLLYVFSCCLIPWQEALMHQADVCTPQGT